MKYGIFGTFSFGDTHEHLSTFELLKNGFFTGTIDVDEKGNFTGELEDCYGKSNIKGFLDQKEISFEKEYLSPSKNKFKCTCFRREVFASWAGFWEFTGPNPNNEEHKGQTICSLFLPND